jgi:hypothetical protein
MPIGLIIPKVSVGFTVAPEIVYLPIVPLEVSATKICAQVVPGMAQSATDATKPERINRVFKILLSKSKGKVISAVDPLLCLTPERLGTFGLTESL